MDPKYLLATDSATNSVQPEHQMWLKVLTESAAVGKQLSCVSAVCSDVHTCGARLQ
jgi:hypothetical protein